MRHTYSFLQRHIFQLATGLVLLLIVYPFPTHSNDNPKKNGHLYIEPMVSSSMRCPLGISSSTWKPYPTAGCYITLPSTLKWFSCLFGAEGGIISDHNDELHIQCIHLRFGIQYTHLSINKHLAIYPEIGLSTIMVGDHRGIIDFTGNHFFSSVENEYGTYIGIAPRLTFKRFSLLVPVRVERTFSSPDNFNLIIFSAIFSYHIPL